MPKGTCATEGCEKAVRALGLCASHYMKQRYANRPKPPEKPPVDPLVRLMKYVALSDVESCWTWIGIRGRGGYGKVYWQGRMVPAHRAVCEASGRDVPPDLQADHLCRNRACVNPDHIEFVTQRENIRRGNAPSAIGVRLNRCRRGHEYTPENTYRTKSGSRVCRECNREWQRNQRAAAS